MACALPSLQRISLERWGAGWQKVRIAIGQAFLTNEEKIAFVEGFPRSQM